MIVSKANTAKAFENSPACKGVDFPGTGKDLGGAVISVGGRYPEMGYLTNEVTKELVYVVSGQGTLMSPDGLRLDFTKGDVVFVDSGDIFAWEGEFEGFFANTPVFDPAQHKEVSA